MTNLTDEVLAELEQDCNDAHLMVEVRKSRFIALLAAARRVRELEKELALIKELEQYWEKLQRFNDRNPFSTESEAQ